MANRRARPVVNFLRDFQNFVLRGNVVDLAVAVIMGGAFGRIVESLIADVITPALLQPALRAAQVEELARLSIGGILYGKFLAAVINFIVISFVIFILIRAIEAVKRKEQIEAQEAGPDAQERLIAALDKLSTTIESRAESNPAQYP